MTIRYQVTTKRVALTDDIRREIEAALVWLERRLRHFPTDALQAQIALEQQLRRESYTVRLALVVLRNTFVARQTGPSIGVALDQGTAAVERQVQRYKARLRGDYRYERKRAALSPEERQVHERELLEDRALLDQALLGDRKAFDELTEGELPRLTRYIRRRLLERGITGAALDAQLQQILEQALLAGFERLRQKPESMSLQGWLALQARPLIELIEKDGERCL